MKPSTRLLLTICIGVSNLEKENGIAVNPGFRRYEWIMAHQQPRYPARNLYALLNRLSRDGFVERRDVGSRRVVRITEKGITHLIEREHFLGLRGSLWDRHWWIAAYDVPENNRYTREKIRITLERFRFGKLRGSVYTSPFPVGDRVKEVLAQEGILSSVFLFRAEQDDLGEARMLASRIYTLGALSESYHSILRRLPIVLGQQIPERRRDGLQRVRSDFMSAVMRDPMFPAELLPTDWPFRKVFEALERAPI